MNPMFPIYIVSKGRHESRLTSKTLEHLRVPYLIVVEEQEYADYCSVIDKSKVLVLDKAYQRDYDTFDTLSDSKSKGPGPARNFVWDHSIANGHEWHWVLDDNIRKFYRLFNNLKVPVGDGTVLKCMEDFVLRYKNIAMAGPNYDYLAKRKQKLPPFITNTRIYSCNLIRNSIKLRWRGRYNEDTDLSLRMLKSGWCTVQFNAFLQGKVTTLTMRGGNMDEFYLKEGTLAKSKMQVAMHPDLSSLTWKFGRWHHEVDYRSFKANKLILRDDVVIDSSNDYGMRLRYLKKKAARSEEHAA